MESSEPKSNSTQPHSPELESDLHFMDSELKTDSIPEYETQPDGDRMNSVAMPSHSTEFKMDPTDSNEPKSSSAQPHSRELESDLNFMDSELKTDSIPDSMNSVALPSHSPEFKMDPTDSNEPQSDSDEGCELERQRQRSLMLRKQLLMELNNIPEYRAAIAAQKRKPIRRKSVKRKRYSVSTETPTELRRSSRVRKSDPIYTPMDDPEEVMYKAKRPRSGSRRNSSNNRFTRVIIPVEEITEAHIRNVALQVSTKRYSATYGTSCHQCRQKTSDQKTCCRNVDCIGVRGQFCGVCLRNRYGEDAVAALQNPNWYCPVCRGICNCSFCRIKDGSAPTGILAPIAVKKGFMCVKDYLEARSDYTGGKSEDFNNPAEKQGKDFDNSGEEQTTEILTDDPDIPDSTNNNRTDTELTDLSELKCESKKVDSPSPDEETTIESNTKDSHISSNKVIKADSDKSQLPGEVNVAASAIENPNTPNYITDSEIRNMILQIQNLTEQALLLRNQFQDCDHFDDDESDKILLGFKDGRAIFRYL